MAFITSLRIKNFFSIKNEVTIDFKASPYNIENNPERLFKFNGEYYNKVISFYGANASGKTTILKAITTLSKVITNEQSDYFFSSFKNKFSDINNSSELEISFVLNINGIFEQFNYKLFFKSNQYENIGIENEELYSLSEKDFLFNREKENIKNIDDNIVESLFDNLNDKKSLINEFFKFDRAKKLASVRLFFLIINVSSNINAFNTKMNTTISDQEAIASYLDKTYPEFHKQEFKEFLLNFFSSIGQDIERVEASFKEEDGKEKEFLEIKVYHKINNNEPLAFSLESDGTQMLMKMLTDIFIAKVANASLIIDELDSIVHPMLVPIIINLLIKNDIQIIYSTHNIYNMQFLQNDEIFLIEKDENHLTTIKPIKENKEIKGYENLLTYYENGDLGGIPKIENLITEIF